MAHKPTSFKLDEKKKAIIIYTNVEVEAEKSLIELYLKSGYAPMFSEKKSSKTVKDMRKELSADEEALKKFNEIYEQKNGFFDACKFYSNWKKEQKTK